MIRCPNCGQLCKDTDEFCEMCGTQLPKQMAGGANQADLAAYGQNSWGNYRQDYPVYEEPEDPGDEEEDDEEEPRSLTPIIVGCVMAVLILIVGTALTVTILRGRNREKETISVAESDNVGGENPTDIDNEAPTAGGEENEEGDNEQEDKADESQDQEDEEDFVDTIHPAEDYDDEETEDPAQTDAAEESSSGSQVMYETLFVVNCEQSITLRESPSTGAAEICQIPFGAAVSYVETAENGFYKIIYDGKTGYGLASYLDREPQDQPKPPGSSESGYRTCYVVNCKESITLRKSPSTSADEICQIPLGAAVSYVESASNGFYKIIYNGNTGYSLASYLQFADGGQDSSGEATYMQVVNCKESITLRKTPSTKADQFCQIPLGAVVEFKGTAENGFYMVSYNGYTGYALASYLTEW